MRFHLITKSSISIFLTEWVQFNEEAILAYLHILFTQFTDGNYENK
jgi:hypothetical protein